MRSRFTVTVLLLLAALPMYSQGFRKRLTLDEGAISNIWLCNAPGGGLYVASFRNSSSANFTLFLTKLTAAGDVEWARKSSADRLGIGVTSDPDGNIYLVYEPIRNNAIDGVVVEKITPTGQTVWQKKDGNNSFSLSYHALSYKNGRLFMSHNTLGRHRITAFNSNTGAIVWTHLYDSNVSTVNDNIHQLLALKDGTVLATTQVQNYTSTSSLRSIMRLDQNGDFIKIKSFGGFAIVDMTELTTGNIAFMAKTVNPPGSTLQEKFFIGVLTPNLDFQWLKKVNHPSLQSVEGVEAVDNGAFLVGLQNPGENCLGQSAVFRSDAQGNVEWSKAVKNGAFFAIQQVAMPDNGLAWISYNPAIDTAVIINRVDAQGDIPTCATEANQPFTLVDTTILTSNLDWSITDDGSWTSTTPTAFTNTSWQIGDYCPSIALNASFTLSEDTVCARTLVRATPANNLGNPVWLFGANGSISIQNTANMAQAAMTQTGLIPVTQIRSLGLCSDTVIHFVLVKPGPAAELGASQLICPGDSVILETGVTTGVQYQWSDGSSNATLLVTEPGKYSVLVIGPECSTPDTILIKLGLVPMVSLGQDQVICQEESYLIQPSVSPAGGAYLWSDGSTGETLAVATAGVYRLAVQLPNACSSADSIEITLKDCPTPRVYAPNAFAPDGSVDNSRWAPFAKSATILSVAVYDRWGSQVFFSEQSPFEWDGSVRGNRAGAGVYAFVIRYREEDGGAEQVKTGDLTVVR